MGNLIEFVSGKEVPSRARTSSESGDDNLVVFQPKPSGTDLRGAEECYISGAAMINSNRDKAIEAFRKCLELDPGHARAKIELGNHSYYCTEYGPAEQFYLQAANDDPKLISAHYNLGLLYTSLFRNQDAITSLLKVLELSPDHADAHYSLGFLYDRIQDKSKAVRHMLIYVRLTNRQDPFYFSAKEIIRNSLPEGVVILETRKPGA